MLYANIPEELRQLNQWVCWKLESRTTMNGHGSTALKYTKVPYCPQSGRLASVNDPSDWASFEYAAVTALNYDGIGFVLTANDPYAFIDLDKSDDPNDIALQIQIANAFNTYSEKSPGGGLHIICKGSVPSGRRKGKIEVYSSQRYLTMTGDYWKLLPINWQQLGLSQLWESLATQEKQITRYDGNAPQVADDLEIYNRASLAVNGAKFLDLWNGRFTGYYQSQSEADLSLINILAFYTQNRDQIDRMFHLSALGQRTKAQRSGYVASMIQKSFDRIAPPIDISAIQNRLADYQREPGNALVVETIKYPHGLPPAPPPEVKEPPRQAPTSIHDSPYSVPPGAMGLIAQWIYNSSPLPVPEIAIAGAIGLMAGITGRAYNVSSTGLNQYIMLLANTGCGKESIASGISRLIDILRLQMPTIGDFIGPADLASGQGLIKYISESPTKCFVTILGEFGIKLQQISHPRANGADAMLKKVMLDLYNKSGKGDVLRATAYSDSTKNTKLIDAPAFSIIGESVPSKFYESIDEDMISSGLLPRFLIIEYLGPRVQLNETHNQQYPSQELLQIIATLASQSLQLISNHQVINVQFETEAMAASRKMSKECTDRINDSRADIIKNLWNRCHIKTLKLAALVAVGVNPYTPIIQLEHFLWAEKIVRSDIERVSERFHAGQIGDFGSEGDQMKEVLRIVVEYIATEYIDLAGYGVSAAMHNSNVIPYAFVSKRLLANRLFRKDPLGATRAVKRAIGNLVDNGDLVKLTPYQSVGQFNFRGECYVLVHLQMLEEAKRKRMNVTSQLQNPPSSN